MKRGLIWMVLTCLMAISMVLVSCAKTASTPTSTHTTTSTTTTKTTTTTTVAPPTTSTTTTAANGNFWDKLGTPQYGGTMTIRVNSDITNFDSYFNMNLMSIESAWKERLFTDDWTLDPTVFSYQLLFRPSEYEKGLLAASWEFTDPTTFVVHLRQGIHWQNIPPANGREFIADDVAFHWNRLYDSSKGTFTKGGVHSTTTYMASLISVSASDKYTVVFKWKTPNQEFILECLMLGANSENCIENPDAVKQWGDLNDWHHAIGTGPFILTDFVSGSSATLAKNPDYWGYDERYPKNKLPYIDTLKVLIIPDDATALAGLRSGKIDNLDGRSLQQAQDTKKTNPEILQVSIPYSSGFSIEPRYDVVPFKDIRVREALQMAIDLPTIAKSYYVGTTDPYPLALTSTFMTGWGFPYSQWPQDLKDQYAYNPTAAKKLLADAGYPNGFKTDIVVDAPSDMDLLQIVKSYFAAINVDMDIRVMDYASWTSFVQVSRKHDQLSQRSTGGKLGQTNEPFTQLAKFMLTTSTNYQMVNDPAIDAFYSKAMAATSVADVKQVIKDCNEYVARQHFSISLLQPMTFSLAQPWVKGYNGQYGSLYGNWGPSFLFFYPARFWIDLNLKKSLGH